MWPSWSGVRSNAWSTSRYSVNTMVLRALAAMTAVRLHRGPSCAGGDLSDDGVVDFVDAQLFAPCMSGPDVGIMSGCKCADLDGDPDSDLRDFALLQDALLGS